MFLSEPHDTEKAEKAHQDKPSFLFFRSISDEEKSLITLGPGLNLEPQLFRQKPGGQTNKDVYNPSWKVG
jgi:hypothetical protein